METILEIIRWKSLDGVRCDLPGGEQLKVTFQTLGIWSGLFKFHRKDQILHQEKQKNSSGVTKLCLLDSLENLAPPVRKKVLQQHRVIKEQENQLLKELWMSSAPEKGPGKVEPRCQDQGAAGYVPTQPLECSGRGCRRCRTSQGSAREHSRAWIYVSPKTNPTQLSQGEPVARAVPNSLVEQDPNPPNFPSTVPGDTRNVLLGLSLLTPICLQGFGQ